ncbi:hypothetical protein UlMin_011937 [Ulmus minor]
MLGLQKHPTEFETCDLMGKELPQLEMWECFLNAYTRGVGFGIQIHTTVRSQSRGLWRREWVCSRRPKDCTRCGCMACFHVLKSVSGNSWRVTKFEPKHNQILVAQEHLQFLRSNLGFTKKDAYNKAVAIHRSQSVETNSEGLIGYLALKIDSTNLNLFAKYAIDEEDRLCHIFWADSGCQRDYMCFSDVLAFDTTYWSNAFNKPFVMFVGVNNHFRTCVFSFALLLNEKIDSYKWVLENFLDCTQNRQPTVVVTDGDAAMKVAISICFPTATH